jgi:hypothetical protein
VITGYNTDIEHDGVVYHIQTEDKGLETPVILSLVYTGGEVLASKRSPYDDLIAGGFDQEILAERLQRQHKLICAAVHAGRIEDLKQLRDFDPVENSTRRRKSMVEEPISTEDESGKSNDPASPSEQVEPEDLKVSQDRLPVSDPAADQDSLQVTLLEEKRLRGGESVTLRVLVSRGSPEAREPVGNAQVIVKTLGTSFRPSSTFSRTDKDGVALISASLPVFEEGRAAILVRAEFDGATAELRRIILPA